MKPLVIFFLSLSQLCFASFHQSEFPRTPKQIRSIHSGLCLEVSHNSQQPGEQIIQWYCKQNLTNGNGFVHLERNPDGSFKLRFLHSNLCVAEPYGWETLGIVIIQGPCTPSVGDKPVSFMLEPIKNKRFLIHPAGAPHICLGISERSRLAYSSVVQQECNGHLSQQFETTD